MPFKKSKFDHHIIIPLKRFVKTSIRNIPVSHSTYAKNGGKKYAVTGAEALEGKLKKGGAWATHSVLTPKHSLGQIGNTMNTITLNNYFDQTKGFDFSKLPATIQKGNDFMKKADSAPGGVSKMYNDSEGIKKMIDIYLAKLNEAVPEKQAPVPEPEPVERKEEPKKPARSARPKKEPKEKTTTPAAAKPKKKKHAAPKKQKAKKAVRIKVKQIVKTKIVKVHDEKPVQKVKRYSPELNIIRSFLSLAGKARHQKRIEALINRVKSIRALKNHGHKPALSMIEEKLNKIKHNLSSENGNMVKLTFTDETTAPLKKIVDNAKENLRVSYLAGPKKYKMDAPALVIAESLGELIEASEIPEIKMRLIRGDRKKLLGKITSSKDAADFLKTTYKKGDMEMQEHFNVLYLDRKNSVIGYYRHSSGGRAGTIADIPLILAPAIKTAASGMIVSHNHPSGNLKPSEADIKLSRQLKEACKIHDISLLDSLIITKDGYNSMADEGLLGLSGCACSQGFSGPKKKRIHAGSFKPGNTLWKHRSKSPNHQIAKSKNKSLGE